MVGRDGGVHELRIRDSRDDGELLPDSVGDKQVRFDFTDDLNTYTPSAYWTGVITMKGWGGSYRAFQLLSSASSEGTSAVDTEPLYFRSGEDNVWGAMREVLTFPVGPTGSTPNADGLAGQVLQTDGAGTLSWASLNFVDLGLGGQEPFNVAPPATGTEWLGAPPITIEEALNRLAVIVSAMNGGPIP